MPWTLPPLPDHELLADLCREAAEEARVRPGLVEKDLHLTRLLSALDERLSSTVLLKGGTLLSKVDLGFYRMSEDVDLVLPGIPSTFGRANADRIKTLRTALVDAARSVGATLSYPAGQVSERNSHALWVLEYDSSLAPQRIQVEASIRPVLDASGVRRVQLRQLLDDPLGGDYSGASCHALSATEARAEKVRAAFTREEARDFYDLQQLLSSGADLSSAAFVALVDKKLAELGYAPMREQGRHFGLDGHRRMNLEASARRDLPPVLRADAPPFDIQAILDRFDGLWPHDRARPGPRLLRERGPSGPGRGL